MQKDSAYVAKIEKDIREMYLDTKKNLEDPDKVPYMDFGDPYMKRWIASVEKYKRESVPDKYHQEVRTYFDKYHILLYEFLMSKPYICHALEKGKISEDESQYYYDLVDSKKPFKPFSRK